MFITWNKSFFIDFDKMINDCRLDNNRSDIVGNFSKLSVAVEVNTRLEKFFRYQSVFSENIMSSVILRII